MKKKPLSFTLSYDECPTHRFGAICLNSSEGHGRRLTSSKCCGRWDTLKAFRMSPRDLREAAEEFLNAAEALEATLPVAVDRED